MRCVVNYKACKDFYYYLSLAIKLNLCVGPFVTTLPWSQANIIKPHPWDDILLCGTASYGAMSSLRL
jgi:hypothetical protein